MPDGTSQRTLWLLKETAGARFYSKLPPERHPTANDCLWIPRSIIEHTSKTGKQHIVTLPDWFIEKRNL